MTRWRVGVYRPVGVERATLISAFGRTVSVGLSEDAHGGVIEERKRGHSSMAFERVFRRTGR